LSFWIQPCNNELGSIKEDKKAPNSKVQPVSALPRDSATDLELALLDLSIEALRFIKSTERLTLKINETDARRLTSKVSYFRTRVEQAIQGAGFSLVEPQTGEAYEPGMAVTAINLGEFHSDDDLVIELTIEPIVMGQDGQIRRWGSVLLKRAEA
jgi:hypothetical protein